MKRFAWLALGVVLAAGSMAHADEAPLKAEIVSVRKVWDQGQHNAFTDLARYHDRWYCVFREGAGHVSDDGKVRVLVSDDGEKWDSAALLADDAGDLRDPKICVTPEGKLMISTVLWTPKDPRTKHQSRAYFSRDGRNWGEPVNIGERNFWLWRTSWRDDAAYNIGYSTHGDRAVRLYRSADGRAFEPIVRQLDVKNKYPNEASIAWDADGTAVAIVRCEDPAQAHVGTARPPYTEWTWKNLGQNLGGPHLIQHASGAWLAAGRIYKPTPHTSLCWIDPAAGKLVELAKLPSGGDTSYPGLAWHDGELWMSYYSSHEGKTAVYVARLKVE